MVIDTLKLDLTCMILIQNHLNHKKLGDKNFPDLRKQTRVIGRTGCMSDVNIVGPLPLPQKEKGNLNENGKKAAVLYY